MYRSATQMFADRPAKIRRPQVAKFQPRLEGTPDEARQAQAMIRALERKVTQGAR